MIRQQATAIFIVAIFFIVGCNDDSIPQATMDNGKKVYNTYCLGCHMQDAMGVPRMNPPLAGSELLLKDKTKPIRIVLRGSEELKGQPERDYKNVMAALGNLSDKDIADVLTFARNSFGNKAPKVTEADVRSVRSEIR
jgi:mono/diheme cytochrome c family protein